jgi:Spy/CpxP family protein refolding chaperone
MQKRRVLAAALATMVLIPALAVAAGRRASPAEVLRSPKLLAKYLALTPDQVVQEEALFTTLKGKLEAIHQQQKVVRDQLAAELAKPSPDKCTVGDLVLKVDGFHEQTAAALQEFDTAFKAILTAEQLVKYEALKQLAHGRP